MLPLADLKKLDVSYDISDPWRLERLKTLWQRYESSGLIRDGSPVALHRFCQCSATCWAGRARPAGRGPTIHLPWIGTGYEAARPRVLVIAMNLRIGDEDTDAFVQLDVIKNKVLPRFRCGAERGVPAFCAFHSRAWQAASQIQVGPAVRPWVSDQDRIDALNSGALLEAVKCPTHPDGPTENMWATCPKFVGLREEIELLEPDVLLALGADIPAALQASGLQGDWRKGAFIPVDATVGGRVIPAYCLHHPRRPKWNALCLNRLEELLRRQPARPGSAR